MSITTTWKIDKIECAKDNPGIVETIHWRLYASSGEHEVSIFGLCVIDFIETPDFILYQNLTEGDVVAWVHSDLREKGVERAEDAVKKILVSKIHPGTEPETLPWQTS